MVLQVQAVFNPLASLRKDEWLFHRRTKGILWFTLPPTNFSPGLISIISLEIIRLEGNLGYFWDMKTRPHFSRLNNEIRDLIRKINFVNETYFGKREGMWRRKFRFPC